MIEVFRGLPPTRGISPAGERSAARVCVPSPGDQNVSSSNGRSGGTKGVFAETPRSRAHYAIIFSRWCVSSRFFSRLRNCNCVIVSRLNYAFVAMMRYGKKKYMYIDKRRQFYSKNALYNCHDRGTGTRSALIYLYFRVCNTFLFTF